MKKTLQTIALSFLWIGNCLQVANEIMKTGTGTTGTDLEYLTRT